MPEQWNLEGTYFETCNCDSACPCVFLSDPTTGDCTVLVAWHIEQGRYAHTTLDGLNVALAAHAPGNMATTKWQAALYFDQNATADQQQALQQIFTGQAGGHPQVLVSFVSEVLGAGPARIDYRAEGKRRSVRIAGFAEAEIEAISGQGSGDVTISGHPLAVAPGFPAVAAKSTKLSYHDHGLSWEISGKNGFYSPFAYRGG